MTAALVVGSVIALVVLAYVLYPVFFPSRTRAPRRKVAAPANDGDLAVVALREIEFDRATGKLSDADYASLRQRYVDRAVVEMRRESVDNESGPPDAIEAAVQAYRSSRVNCPTCGPRPETDAVYCSDCGHFLPAQCDACQAPVVAAGARYCTECGNRLRTRPRHSDFVTAGD